MPSKKETRLPSRRFFRCYASCKRLIQDNKLEESCRNVLFFGEGNVFRSPSSIGGYILPSTGRCSMFRHFKPSLTYPNKKGGFPPSNRPCSNFHFLPSTLAANQARMQSSGRLKSWTNHEIFQRQSETFFFGRD